MDLLPPAAQPDQPIHAQQAATTALPRLSKESILSLASFASSANVDDPTRNIDDGRRHTSFVKVLKSSLVELAKLDGDFNHLWIQEFRELYFNPLPLKRLCYAMCLGSVAMSFIDYFDKIAEKDRHESLGIAQHPGEPF